MGVDMFHALADPTRRHIIELLASNGQLSATEISAKFPVSPPAISQHLQVLRQAKLVQMEKRVQRHIYYLNTDTLVELEDWARQMTDLWNQRFNVLDKVLESEKRKSRKREIKSKDKMTNQNKSIKELTLTRIFDAPRELVFKAWTDPQILAQWWSPSGFTNTVRELDVRPGGAMYIDMCGPDGVTFPMHAVFSEVIEPERLVFTASAYEDAGGNPQLQVVHTVTLAEQADGKTKLTLHAVVVKSAPAVADAIAGMEPGWNQSLDKLAESLEKV